MVASIALAFLTLRAGLALRRPRLAGQRRPPELRRRHVRLAKPAVVFILIGFAAGIASAIFLRGWTPFSTFHAALAVVAAGLFTATAILGRRLETGRSRALDPHAILGGLAVLLAAVAAVAGFVILP